MRPVMFSCFLFLSIALVSVTAHGLTVEKGLVPYQVVQCGDGGNATFALSGATNAAGTLQARVSGVQKEILPWADLGKVAGGAWQGSISGVPAGGPYRVELRLCDDAGTAIETASIPEVLVGDVWVLAGQSNMQGVGNRIDVEQPHPLVHTFALGNLSKIDI